MLMAIPSLPTIPSSAPNSTLDVREVTAAREVTDTVLLLMGVSGCGKSTIALELQRLLKWPFKEGDDLHPAANVEKMRSGRPLDDQDRQPWLMAVARWIDDRLAAGEPGIITCSNLKRAYRNITVGDRTGVTLIYLRAEERLIVDRVSQRKHRYMPASLLHSQFETLQEPTANEHAIVVSADGAVADTVIDLLHKVVASQHSVSRDGISRS
jgi:carbohydrate kinase (thermoresistant glucokinase family)